MPGGISASAGGDSVSKLAHERAAKDLAKSVAAGQDAKQDQSQGIGMHAHPVMSNLKAMRKSFRGKTLKSRGGKKAKKSDKSKKSAKTSRKGIDPIAKVAKREAERRKFKYKKLKIAYEKWTKAFMTNEDKGLSREDLKNLESQLKKMGEPGAKLNEKVLFNNVKLFGPAPKDPRTGKPDPTVVRGNNFRKWQACNFLLDVLNATGEDEELASLVGSKKDKKKTQLSDRKSYLLHRARHYKSKVAGDTLQACKGVLEEYDIKLEEEEASEKAEGKRGLLSKECENLANAYNCYHGVVDIMFNCFDDEDDFGKEYRALMRMFSEDLTNSLPRAQRILIKNKS